MSDPDRLTLTRDTRHSDLVTAVLPAWLWSADGRRILWSNAVGAAMFGATPEALAQRRFDPKSPPAQQVARLAAALPADGTSRLERRSRGAHRHERHVDRGAHRDT